MGQCTCACVCVCVCVFTLLVCVVDVQECDVVSVDVSKPHLCLVRLLLLVPWSDEDLWHCECVCVRACVRVCVCARVSSAQNTRDVNQERSSRSHMTVT